MLYRFDCRDTIRTLLYDDAFVILWFCVNHPHSHLFFASDVLYVACVIIQYIDTCPAVKWIVLSIAFYEEQNSILVCL